MLKLFHTVDSSEPAIVETDDIETEINEHTIDLEIDLDRREIDKKEEEIVKTFVVEGCACNLNGGNGCSKFFSEEHYQSMRNQCVKRDHDSLDLLIMGQIMANTTQSSTVIEHTTRCDKERERVTTQFFHQGKKVKVSGQIPK